LEIPLIEYTTQKEKRMIMRHRTGKFGIVIIACFLVILFSTATPEAEEKAPGEIPPKGPADRALAELLARANSAENLPDITNKNLRDRVLARTAEEFLGAQDVSPQSGAGMPHAADSEGAWFQGWYTRITDENGASIAVVGATQYLPGMPIPADGYLPGYLAVIVSEQGRTKVYEAFPAHTVLWSNRALVLDDPHSPAWEEFFWYSEENGVITNEYIDISIAEEVDVSAILGPRVPYNSTNPELGPEGLVEFLSFVPLHWFVYSLGSETSYTYTMLDEGATPVSGFGCAHQESSWGALFPPAWVWAEGISADNTRQFALSGGELPLGDTSLTTWLVAFHSPRIKWEFRPTLPGTRYITSIDSCAGSFSMIAKDSLRKLVITAQAPPESFFHVSVPTENGFMPGAVESFAAEVSVRVYLTVSWFGDLPVDLYHFSGAALEFGAGYMCQ
jgi:hypothetical protein